VGWEQHGVASSLVICSRDRPRLLLESLESIVRGDGLPDEIVVVDQSAVPHPVLSAGVPDWPCEVRYAPVGSRGLSRARNEGIGRARYPWLVFTDDDVAVSPSWYRTLLGAAVAAGPRTVLTGQVLPGASGKPGGFAPSTKIDPYPREYVGRVGEGVLQPLNMCLHRSAFAEVGLFDARLGAGTSFPSSEDNDLCFRLLEAGYRVVYQPEAVVYHRAWRPSHQYWALRWGYGVGQGAFYAKYFDRRDGYMLGRFWGEVAGRTGTLTRRVRTEPRRACGDLVYLAGLAVGAARWLGEEGLAFRTRTAGRVRRAESAERPLIAC
jgi:GT2 family glycosyltransferase